MVGISRSSSPLLISVDIYILQTPPKLEFILIWPQNGLLITDASLYIPVLLVQMSAEVLGPVGTLVTSSE